MFIHEISFELYLEILIYIQISQLLKNPQNSETQTKRKANSYSETVALDANQLSLHISCFSSLFCFYFAVVIIQDALVVLIIHA